MVREGAARRPLSFKPYALSADRTHMASQLRLHVLLPIALLGLLGAGFGAYAVGNKPAGSDPSGVPLITTHPDKTKPKPHQQKLDDADWVKGLQAWCAGVDGRIQAIDKPQTVADFESALGEYVQVWDSAEPSFMKLGLPKKQQRVAIRLRANIKASVAKLRGVFNHTSRLDLDWLQAQLDDAKALDVERNELTKELGAGTCFSSEHEGAGSSVIQPAPLLINSQLKRYGKVVVLFYEPGASYDAIQTREARAGALAAHAGFVSVNVSKNREVGQLAAQYGVLESPTVLIFTRDLKLQARLEGLYDRTAVVQAVKNA
jgi:hypothetical protein